MHTRALTSLAIATTALAACAGLTSSAAAVGTACTASSVSLSSPDRATFTWTMPVTWPTGGSARILARPADGSAAFSTLTTLNGIRTAGVRSTVVGIPALASGSWSWRVELTPPAGSGTVDYCDAAATMTVARPLAPTMSLAGAKLTADGWRAHTSGQTVQVTRGSGDPVSGTSYVRFQAPSGIWGGELTSPAAIPATDVIAVQAYRRSSAGMSGPATTIALRSDITAPSAPPVSHSSVTVGTTGALVMRGASVDDGSGVSHYESSVRSASGAASPWTIASSQSVAVAATDAGGVLRIRACDRVGNCSPAAEVELHSATAPGGSSPSAPGSRTTRPPAVNRETPRITALVAKGAAGGAARVAVTLSRPAEVSLVATSGSATVASATVWLGSGTTLVRIPGGTRAVRGAQLTARPAAAGATGDAVTAAISLPAVTRAARKGETARRTTTRMRAGAMAMLYDLDSAVREVVHPSDGAAGLTGAQGARRQEPSTSGLFGTDDEQWMYGKVKLAEIIDMSSDEMVTVIREAIEDSPSHIIGIDEVTTSAADPVAPNVKGGRVPPTDPGMPGAQFAAALAALDTPSPYGGTWASRIHVYLAPAMTSAIAAGKGPDRNLGRDGRPHFRTYRTVLGGLSHVAGVWIEMYHGLGVTITSPFTVAEWKTAPAAVAAEFTRAGGDMTRLHMLITGSDRYPTGGPLPSGCVTPQRCAWVMAESTPAGRQILANGVGGYRLAESARAFLAEWHLRL